MQEEQTKKENKAHWAVTLLQSEMTGKVRATGDYDNIIWKIRAGYVAILYGSLALLLGQKEAPDLSTLNLSTWLTIMTLIYGFSLTSLIVDFAYVCKKMRVTAARDGIMDKIVNEGLMESFSRGNVEKLIELDKLLVLSGESDAGDFPPDVRGAYQKKRNNNLYWILLPLYSVTPFLVTMAFIVSNFR